MGSQIDLFNRALGYIGTRSIQAFSDNTKEASLCRQNYDLCRRVVLRMFPWRFASSRAVLSTPNANPVAFEWTYAYDLPSDFVRVITVGNAIDVFNPDIYWIREGEQILTDETILYMRYVYDYNDVDTFDPIFFESLALYLAWSICYSVTGSDTKVKSVWDDFQKIIKTGKFVDSTEHPWQSLDADMWINSRVGPNQGFVRDPQT